MSHGHMDSVERLHKPINQLILDGQMSSGEKVMNPAYPSGTRNLKELQYSKSLESHGS